MERDIFTLYALSTVGGLVLLATAYFAYTRPRAAVPVGFFLVLLADTKFRFRDVSAALAAEVDSQILFELGLYGLIATISVMLFAAARRGRAALKPLELLLCGYILVCVASSAWSVTMKVTMVRSLQLLVLFAFVHASVRAVGSERTVRALTASCTLYVLSCAALVLLVPQLHTGDAAGRFAWFAVHPISAGAFAAIAALWVLSIGLFSAKGWRDRVLWCPVWLYPLPLVTVLLMTNSRGPILAFTGATGILLLKRLRPHAATLAVSTVLIVILTVLGSTGSLDSYLQTSKTSSGDVDELIVRRLLRGQTADQFLGLSGRIGLWQSTITEFYREPVIGVGYQASRSVLVSTVFWAGHAHNAYLQTLLDVGALGAVFLFSSLLLVLVRGFPGRRRHAVRWEEYAIFGPFIFLLLNSITDETFAVAGHQLAVMFACAVVAARPTLVESQLDWRHTRRVAPKRRGSVRASALPLHG
jgi:exopolysaccharide production protein ExoQ